MINVAKRVVVISSSPRKGGNSDTLCDEFVKGAVDGGKQSNTSLMILSSNHARHAMHAKPHKESASRMTRYL